MCISILTPKKSIKIIYASESVWLSKRKGIPEIVADLLIQNTSTSEIKELWCIVPQRMFNQDGSYPKGLKFEDITSDLTSEDSQYTKGEAYRAEKKGLNAVIKLTLPDPTDPVNDICYEGTFSGNNEINPLTTSARQRVLMNKCCFAVIEILLGTPIQATESRWFRFKICPRTGPQERRNWIFLFRDMFRNKLTFSYCISGPRRVIYDVEKNLASILREAILGNDKNKWDGLNDIRFLISKIIVNGIKHNETKVEIEDWRTRFFQWPMEMFSSIQSNDAVRIVGAQPNYAGNNIKDAYYEWASGRLQINTLPPKTEHGYFTIRFVTKYELLIHPALPILALAVSILSILLAIFRT